MKPFLSAIVCSISLLTACVNNRSMNAPELKLSSKIGQYRKFPTVHDAIKKASKRGELVSIADKGLFWMFRVKSSLLFPTFPQSFYIDANATTNDYFCSPSPIVPNRWVINIGGSMRMYDSNLSPLSFQQPDGSRAEKNVLFPHNSNLEPSGAFILTVISIDERPKDNVVFFRFFDEAEVLMDSRRQLILSHVWK